MTITKKLRDTVAIWGVLGFITVTTSAVLGQMPSNVFERVVHLRVNAGTPRESTATGFTIAVDGKQYLITAAHVVSGMGDDPVIGIEQGSKWIDLRMKAYRCEPPTDIAVLIPPQQLTVNFALSSEGVEFYLGQDAFFLGFPYGQSGNVKDVNGSFPLALIKKGVASSIVVVDQAKKVVVLLLDGYNNPGFSGGPVVARDFRKPVDQFGVVGVISGFEPEVVPVMERSPIQSPQLASEKAKEQPWRIRRNPDETYFEYKDTESSVSLNTGIVVSYEIGPAIDLVRSHPDGPKEENLVGQPILKSNIQLKSP